MNKIHSPEMAKTAVFMLLESSKFISRKNLSHTKILKFPNCDLLDLPKDHLSWDSEHSLQMIDSLQPTLNSESHKIIQEKEDDQFDNRHRHTAEYLVVMGQTVFNVHSCKGKN